LQRQAASHRELRAAARELVMGGSLIEELRREGFFRALDLE
jgi:hypothetical protein